MFTFDSTGMEGRTFIVKEYLYEGVGESGELLAKDDKNPNEPETVYVPEIRTTATTEDGIHSAYPAEDVVIRDEVFYTNLYPGQEYRASGVLMDKESGEPLTDADGEEIRAELTFTPEEPDGSVILEFTLDASAMSGMSVVAFEELQAKNINGDYEFLTEHKDIDDEEQTVRFPAVSTKVATAENLQVAKGEGIVRITDTVHVSNAVVGTNYVVAGVIVRHSDGEALADGEEILSSLTEGRC